MAEQKMNIYDADFAKDEPLARNSVGMTRLTWAASSGAVEDVKRFLADENYDPNDWGDQAGFTPIAAATYYGRVECVKALLADPRVEPNPLDAHRRTPLILAAERGELGALMALIDTAATDHESRDGDTALTSAAFHGHVDCVKFLVGVIDPNERCSDGSTALMKAAESDSAETVRFLLPISDMKAVSANGENPLMRAASWGSSETLRELLPYYDVQACNGQGKTALDLVNESIEQGVSDNPQKLRKVAKFLKAYIHARNELAAISSIINAPNRPMNRSTSRI